MDKRPSSYIVIIPSLDPDGHLPQVVQGMLHIGFTRIVLVDDGSDAAHQAPFTEASALPGVEVLRHEQNRGKGRALKTAFSHIVEKYPDAPGVITVDGDGQHLPEDVWHIAETMTAAPDAVVFGVRDFDAAQVPARSRFGNKLTRAVVRRLCGLPITDTQTGLRGFPLDFLPALLPVEGERYEFETNMLPVIRKSGRPYREVPISTVYENNNEGSHFRPVRDSVRIYWCLLRYFVKYVCSSIICMLVDQIMFRLFCDVVFVRLIGDQQIIIATALARIISGSLNFVINRNVVFHSSTDVRRTGCRYILLCVGQMLCSAAFVAVIARMLPGVHTTIIKCVVDTALFFAGYWIQRKYVFREEKK